MAEHVRLLFFAGSAREDSWNKKLAKLGAEIAQANGLPSTFADLGDYPMPLYDGDLESAEGPPETAVDPVCGMTVAAAECRNVHEHGGARYFFCCGACLKRFAEAPERFIAATS